MLRDIRYALRSLRGAPAFAITVVLTLGIGLGLNTTLFTLFNAYVLRPFAVNDPYSLYNFEWRTTRGAGAGLTWEQYQDLRAQAPVFSDTVAFSPVIARVESRNSYGFAVSGNYFTMFRVGALHGRPILPEDASIPGSRAVVVLSHQFWTSAFAGDPAIVGRTIRIADRPFEVVGVGPPDFAGVAELPIDFFIPLTMQSAVLPGPDLFGPQKPRGIMVIGRLRPEIPVERAKAALSLWIERSTAEWPENERAIQATLQSAATPLSRDSELLRQLLPVFLPLVVVFGLVLVICCANVSNMMLARALARQKEIGVRLAMGAARSRLIRQLLSENLLLSLVGRRRWLSGIERGDSCSAESAGRDHSSGPESIARRAAQAGLQVISVHIDRLRSIDDPVRTGSGATGDSNLISGSAARGIRGAGVLFPPAIGAGGEPDQRLPDPAGADWNPAAREQRVPA